MASVRDPQKATALADRGVAVRAGDFARPDELAAAFAGAEQVLVVIPLVGRLSDRMSWFKLFAASLEQGKPVSHSELDEVLGRVKQDVRFTIDYKGMAEAIQPHLATPAKVETTLTRGTAQLQQVIAQIPCSVPVVG